MVKLLWETHTGGINRAMSQSINQAMAQSQASDSASVALVDRRPFFTSRSESQSDFLEG